MTKKEIIWREIIEKAASKKQLKFTQKELAQKFGFSLSTIFNALKIPRLLGAVKVGGRSFSVTDLEKFLYIFATNRNIEKEIIYETHVPEAPGEIEGQMPAGAIFGAYSAYNKKYPTAPADYDKVYVYANLATLAEIKKRFPKIKGYANLFVLKSDQSLDHIGAVTPDVQTFVDLWNLKDWYAKDYLNELKKKILN
jgi:hypothetical protein